MHYFVNQFAVGPDVPGGTRHYEFASRLNAAGVRVDVLASDINLGTRRYTRRASAWDRKPFVETLGNVRFHWLHTLVYERNDWRRAANMLRFAQSALAYLLRVPVGPETVFVGSSPTLFAAAAAQTAARIRGVRFVFEVRDLWPESMSELSGKDGLTVTTLAKIADHLYRSADRIIVLAKQNAHYIGERGIPEERFVYLPNSVDLDVFDASAAGDLPHGVEPGRFVAVYAGAHGLANDLGTALDAAAILKDGGDRRVHILLVGDGTEKSNLRARVEREGLDNVTLADPIPKSEIPGLLRSCGVGLHTLQDVPLFRYGVSPNKLFDYMAAGLPVITNVAGECADIVGGSGAGRVVPPADPRALAGALAEMADAKDRGRMGEAGRAYVGEHHNRETLAKRYAQVLAGD